MNANNRKIVVFFTKLSSLCEMIGMGISLMAGVGAFLLVCGNILSRQLFVLQAFLDVDWFHPSPWTEELSRWLLIVLTFISSSVAFKRGEHVGITFVVGRFSGFPQRLLFLAGDFIILLFLLVCMGLSFIVALKGFSQTGDIIPFSMAWVKGTLPLGFGFMVIHGVAKLLVDCKEL